jgi:hypothetical protein
MYPHPPPRPLLPCHRCAAPPLASLSLLVPALANAPSSLPSTSNTPSPRSLRSPPFGHRALSALLPLPLAHSLPQSLVVIVGLGPYAVGFVAPSSVCWQVPPRQRCLDCVGVVSPGHRWPLDPLVPSSVTTGSDPSTARSIRHVALRCGRRLHLPSRLLGEHVHCRLCRSCMGLR